MSVETALLGFLGKLQEAYATVSGDDDKDECNAIMASLQMCSLYSRFYITDITWFA